MGEGPDGDEVDARLRDRPGLVQAQPPLASSRTKRVAAARPTAARSAASPMCQQDEPGPGSQRLPHLVQVVALDLERQAGRPARTA